MQVMRQFGVSLPHYSGSQAKMGKAVTSGNMRPGDLIFYAGSGGQVNHVAIYIGNGQVVHAASRKSGIKISTWNYRSPVAIRNVLGDSDQKYCVLLQKAGQQSLLAGSFCVKLCEGQRIFYGSRYRLSLIDECSRKGGLIMGQGKKNRKRRDNQVENGNGRSTPAGR